MWRDMDHNGTVGPTFDFLVVINTFHTDTCVVGRAASLPRIQQLRADGVPQDLIILLDTASRNIHKPLDDGSARLLPEGVSSRSHRSGHLNLFDDVRNR